MKKRILFVFTVIVIALFVISMLELSPPVHAAETVVYSEGFETSDGGYTHWAASGSPDEWQWGVPANPSGPSAAHSGTMCWGTNLATDPPVTTCYLESPGITLPSITASQSLRVRFWGWINVYFMYPRGELDVSTDNSNWTPLCALLGTMTGGWSAYDFDISNYAGQTIYLRFKLYNPDSGYPGFYIDDVSITQYDLPTVKTTLSLTGYEDISSDASCPWVFSGTSSGYVPDNDIYSTAQGASSEYTDYYTLNVAPTMVNNQYQLKLSEISDETSYTDMVKLQTVDHSATTKIASDENGNIWTYSNPVAPVTATDQNGTNVLSSISTIDDSGVNMYNGDFVTLNFSNVDTTQGATLVMKAVGFKDNGTLGTSLNNPPRIFIQTQDSSGNWVTRNAFYPRNNFSITAYNLQPFLGSDKMVRLFATSCLTGKYHVLDYVGLDNNPQAPISVNTLEPISAAHSGIGNVLSAISSADGQYVKMGAGDSISLGFAAPPIASGQTRDFVFVTKGYYVPDGTFFIFTWDGSSWVERDGYTSTIDSTFTHNFDVSLFLPDVNGQFRVKIWQDYQYESAWIDYVGIYQSENVGVLNSAWDYKTNQNVTTQLSAADSVVDSFASSESDRNRWVECNFTITGAAVPPSAGTVSVDTATSPPKISWTYSSSVTNPQSEYQVEVWQGAGASGQNMWNPPAGTGTASSVTYAGLPLTPGQTYYARVKVFDGTSWSQWSETSFVAGGASSIVDHFVVSAPSSVTAGSAFGVTITAVDSSGNPVTSYSGTPTLSYSAGSISPSTAPDFTNGVWSGSVTVTAATSGGTISVADGSITGTSNTFSVTHASAVSVSVNSTLSSVTAGATSTFSTTASDSYGNTWDVTSSTTWRIDSAAGGSWSGSTYTSAKAGTWTVTGTCGSTQCTSQLTVTPGSLDHFALSVPSLATTSRSFSLTITAQDAFGNTATSFTGSVSLSSNVGSVNPSSAGPFVGGLWSGSAKMPSAGSAVITLNDGNGHTGTSNTIFVSPPPLTATISLASGSSTTVASGTTVKLKSAVSGGETPYQYQWVVYISPNSTANQYIPGQTSSTLQTTQTTSGKYTYFLLASDSTGQLTVSNKIVITFTSSATTTPTPTPTATSTPTPPTSPTSTTNLASSITSLSILIAVVAAIIIVVLIVLVGTRSRKRRTHAAT